MSKHDCKIVKAHLKYDLCVDLNQQHAMLRSRTDWKLFLKCLRQGMIHVQFDGKAEGCFWRHARWSDVQNYILQARPGFQFIGQMKP